MPEHAADPWLDGFVTAIAAASIMTWLFLLSRPRRWPFLPYEQREPVPWGFAGAALAMVFLAMKIVDLFGEPSDESLTASEMVTGVLLQGTVVGVFLCAVSVLSGAKPRDLGVDSFWTRAGRDTAVGILACLAAFVPIFAIQSLLFSLQDAPAKHPLVTMVENDPNWISMAIVVVAAVVIAPICEEVTFRLLLQGWLEKWEDQKLGRLMTLTTAELDAEVGDESEATGPVVSDATVGEQPAVTWEPPRVGLVGLPHGWTPILFSSAAFALAHLGHGTDPIPLFPLAVILGYTYQRTHRILPSIVTHALFNSATVIALWRMFTTGG